MGNCARDKKLWRRPSIADDINGYHHERDQKKEISLEEKRSKRVVPALHTGENLRKLPYQKPILIKSGFLWVRRDNIFSKWKERFVLLTESRIFGFRTKPYKILSVDSLVFMFSLSKVTLVQPLEKKGELLLYLKCVNGETMLLRTVAGIVDWVSTLKFACQRYRKHSMRSTEEFWGFKERIDEPFESQFNSLPCLTSAAVDMPLSGRRSRCLSNDSGHSSLALDKPSDLLSNDHIHSSRKDV